MTTTRQAGRNRLVGIRALPAALVVLVMSLAVASPATAADPFALPDRITDRVGALAGDVDEIRAALDELEAEHGIRMWVVFVDSFDGRRPVQWADAAAYASQLGVRDYLLAVAVEDREYGYVVDDSFVLDDASLAEVAGKAESHLAENPARAVMTAAGAIGTAAASQDASATATDTMPTSFVNLLGAFLMLLVVSSVAAVALGKRSTNATSAATASRDDTWAYQYDDSPSWDSSGGSSGGTRGGGGSF